MRVLVDECCPRAVAQVLTGAGFDVLYVPEVEPGASDDRVAELAGEQGRVIVTQDYDFGEMAVRQGRFGAGLVMVACGSLSPLERGVRVARAMGELAAGLKGRLTIIELKRVRQRELG